MAITVKVCLVPGRLVEVALNDDATVADAYHAADITLTGRETIKVDGSAASTGSSLDEGSVVIASVDAKGN